MRFSKLLSIVLISSATVIYANDHEKTRNQITKKALIAGPERIGVSTVNLEAKMVDGKKTWTPTTVSAKAGRIVFHLVNTFPEPHGFNIPGILKAPLVVQANATLDVPVAIEKKGRYDIVCQLHPAHVKSQLSVD